MYQIVLRKFSISNSFGLLLIPLVLISPSIQAEMALGARAGLLGLGLEVVRPMSESFSLRMAMYGYDYDYDAEKADNEWEFNLDLAATGLVVDWYPFGSGFRASVGYFANSSTLDGEVAETTTYAIGGNTYNVADLGGISAEIELGSSAPYFGVGWGYEMKELGIDYLLDVGVLIQKTPTVTLSISDPDAIAAEVDVAQLTADLAAEANALEDELESFHIYPVVNFGVSYTF